MRIFVDSSLRSAKVEKLQDDPSSDTAQFYRLGSYSSWAILALTILVGWPAIFLGFVDQENRDPWLWVIGGILIGVAVMFLIAEIIRYLKGPKHPNAGDDDEADRNVEMAA